MAAQTKDVTPLGKNFVVGMAEKYGIETAKLWETLKATAFSCKDGPPSNAQMNALLIVASQYGLNPFTREIYAFPDKDKGIVPIVGLDGWLRIMNEHPQFDGYEMRESEKIVSIDDDARPCPEWMEAVIYRKDRTRPVVVREYLDECYRPPFQGNTNGRTWKKSGPWQSHTKRFLRHKTLIQGARIAFGFAGIYEEDEGQRVIEARVIESEALPGDAAEPDTGVYDAAVAAKAPSVERAARLGCFVAATAGAQGVTVGELKEAAGAQFEEFWGHFLAWEGRQRAAEKMALGKQPQAAEAERVEVAEEPEKAEELVQAGPSIFCGRDQEPVYVSFCADSCKHKGGCPDHRKHLETGEVLPPPSQTQESA